MEHHFKPEVLEQLKRLEEKYVPLGQDLAAYLEGLYHTDFLNYWDYIHLDTLLSLQNPRTNIPDEKIFIMYHQITELYFKLCLEEYRQIGEEKDIKLDQLLLRLKRINRYFDNLINSFDVMVEGMDPQQFLHFRMALMPASGFQSVQYRMIEIASTDLRNLVDKAKRAALGLQSTQEEMIGCIYWKEGAKEVASGAKTLTLLRFEEKYTAQLIQFAKAYAHKNLWAVYKSLPEEEQQNPKLLKAMRALDSNVNVNWPLMHYKSAVRYLQRDPEVIKATGGTNWQKYLPPRFQKRVFYPELWTEQELNEWGKGWVDKVLKDEL
ncbi:tryptophan 2,3-dioxygenase [Pontibacter ummariensis]|uniref:Tryptophan 2,3-dioxygenase apoenzyme n=1 Tax=Pontibacter ummariensis TaxID=1610492 RepID=A0A239BUK4_9BACT|nr:tryptophan 2,3-dioxygenase family protein [Pontibacter ummariensis]PRY15651.1 tryptophan 2,3-dioxygenase [Pontibacter ummariensis]SNS10744.1 Tryptophan 2,3-dioxygenase apoenzyme [Pontibacter ummariensis]